MLISFAVENCYSFGEEGAVLSFTRSRKVDRHLAYAQMGGKVLSKAMAIIGPNASGKSNLLKALTFLVWFMSDSFAELKPGGGTSVTSSFLYEAKPTKFVLEFFSGDKEYTYKLTLNILRVLEEELHVREPGAIKSSYVFKRKLVADKYQLKSSPKFDFPVNRFGEIRDNASLLSTALQHNVALVVNIYKNFLLKITSDFYGSGVKGYYDKNKASEYFYNNNSACKLMNNIVKNVDLGISEIEIEKDDAYSDGKKNALLTLISKKYTWFGVHRNKKGSIIKLPYFMESGGTNKLFILLSRLIPVLLNGGLAIIDEVESELHPDMLQYILDLFFSEKDNPLNAQILFTTHCHELLLFLEKYQVTLVEKENLVSSAWRIDQIEGVRPEDNLYKKYRAGVYGATPDLYLPGCDD